jgi:hypothetical protein
VDSGYYLFIKILHISNGAGLWWTAAIIYLLKYYIYLTVPDLVDSGYYLFTHSVVQKVIFGFYVGGYISNICSCVNLSSVSGSSVVTSCVSCDLQDVNTKHKLCYGVVEITNNMHRFAPLLYSIYRLLHVSAAVCHH